MWRTERKGSRVSCDFVNHGGTKQTASSESHELDLGTDPVVFLFPIFLLKVLSLCLELRMCTGTINEVATFGCS